MKEQTSSTKQSKPYLTIPQIPSEEISFRIPKQVEVFEYYTISNGTSRMFSDKDGIIENQKIMDPSMVSYMNLFINGVLQPKENYDVHCGIIKLKTEDLPPKGTPVILQMFKF